MYPFKIVNAGDLMVSVLASILSVPGPSPGWEQFTVTGCVQMGNDEFHTERGNPVMD